MIGVPVGTLLATRGGLVEALVPGLHIGAGALVRSAQDRCIPARVCAVDGARVLLAPFGGLDGIAAGDRVEGDRAAVSLPLGVCLLGRAVDVRGAPLDGGAPVSGPSVCVTDGAAPRPDERRPVEDIFVTGVAAIDGPLAFGVGARIGLFGAPGCGKSTLLESIVGAARADAVVVALVGERGREAQRWIDRLDARSTIVCATSDRSAAERVRAAEVALAQAQALRRRGLHVLLVIDSLARVAAAARDVAIATGEPVGRGGYPPSVFTLLAGCIERAGAFRTGSVTLIATVLSDGSDTRDPVSDACRAALDGHIVLSERLAAQGWFPAIDIIASASRTLSDVATAEHVTAAGRIRETLALLEETREARALGLDPGAGDPAVRRAVDAQAALARFLRQGSPMNLPTTLRELTMLSDTLL